jgi:hypothetical protein
MAVSHTHGQTDEYGDAHRHPICISNAQGAQMRKVSLLETGFIAQTDLIPFGIQQPTTIYRTTIDLFSKVTYSRSLVHEKFMQRLYAYFCTMLLVTEENCDFMKSIFSFKFDGDK